MPHDLKPKHLLCLSLSFLLNSIRINRDQKLCIFLMGDNFGDTAVCTQRHQQDLYFTWAQGGLKNGIICTSFLSKTGWRWSGRVSFSKTRLIERVFSRRQEPRSFYALTQGPYSLCPVDQGSGTWKDFHTGLFYRVT